MTAATAPNARQTPPEKGLIPDGLRTVLIFILIVAVAYLFYDNYKSKSNNQAEIARLSDQLQTLESANKMGEATLSSQISSLKQEIAGTQEAVGSAREELTKNAAQIRAEGQRGRTELSKALASKADTAQLDAQLQAAKSEAESKIGQVSSEVGGVRNQVTSVKTDLDTTRHDVEGTQRELVEVRDTLNAAVAKNAAELAQLRLKGERNYHEFTIPKKNELTKVEDIRLILAKTDQKKGKFNLKIVVDDSQLEYKDRLINQPIQFLVGKNRVRYEVVVNWVQKNQAGGYLSVPKDKQLSAERPSPPTQ